MSQTIRYNPAQVEDKWYEYWEKSGYFSSSPDERESYSIVIPPPNVTGVLHMGHMLNNTIQDVLIRKARLDGKNACWVPGTDHASIATEAKVVRWLREEKGLKKSDLGREAFLEYAWQWKEKYGGIILKQLRKLGASCDWERTAFTMDDTRSQMVLKVFIDLYHSGKLYRGLRMVNWDPQAQTVLSNEEVIYNNENSKLYHVKYQIEGSDHEFVTIATTRPETIVGDSAIAVHPEDDRYRHLRGKRIIVPLVDRSVPLIFDEYVDREFGTGALKITPAHDPNDYEIGLKHNLEVINILNDNGTLNENAQVLIGEDRFAARKKIIPMLEKLGQLVKIEDYLHSVGRSERTNALVEPKLSLQWYVNMKELAGPALEAVNSNEIEFFPENQKNIYRHWMENIRDWCISRQLWWGQRIPAYYYKEEVFVCLDKEEAFRQAQTKFPKENIQMDMLRQDEDVLDTWFSSWLWPISVFDGWDNNEEFNYYYPTSVLVTGWDIIFLWVARMIMAGYEWKGVKPFKHVYFTGMVRDKQRRKMSKQLGNSPDALKLIEKYGADAVRFGMLSCSPAGGDLLFDEKLIEQGRNFCNKIWNASNLIDGWKRDQSKLQSAGNKLSVEWIEHKFSSALTSIEKNFKAYRLSEALINIYTFVWNDFFSWYLEMIKVPKGDGMDAVTYDRTIEVFTDILSLIHPFMPFLSEEIWHKIEQREEGDDCMMSSFPKGSSIDQTVIKRMSLVQDVISKIRDTKNRQQLKMNTPLKLFAAQSNTIAEITDHEGYIDLIRKFTQISSFVLVTDEPDNASPFISGKEKFYLENSSQIDSAAEKERLEKELAYYEGFLVSVRKKLSNERFVSNAPEAVVAKERTKEGDAMAKIANLKDSLEKL